MKQLLVILLVGLSLAPLAGTPQPQGRIETVIKDGTTEVRLAMPEFQPKSADPNAAKLIALFNQVVWDDLDYSGNIALVSRSFYPVGKFQTPTDIKVEDWTRPGVNAQYLGFGNATITGGNLYVEARLWDLGITQNREVVAHGLTSGGLSEDAVRLIAHKFSDMIIDKLFGGRFGISQTQIAYVASTGKTAKGFDTKEIYLMDYDGANPGPLTTYRSTSIMPSWAPDGEKVAFITYRKNTAAIEIMSPVDRRPFPFPAMSGTTGTPAWSPDGSQLAFSSSQAGNTEIYVADWNGRNPKRLTSQKGIDTSPTWNPRSGRNIAFVSDRSGTQQIWTMDAEGTDVQRLVDGGGDAENPAWSPDGQNIAFAWQKPGTGRFDIYIHDLGTGRNSQLTQNAGDNERPSWAPDGRHIVFASTRTGTSQIFSMLANGQKIRQLTRSGKNEGPAWSSFIGK